MNDDCDVKLVNGWLNISEPKITLGRYCEICGETFIINRVNDPRTICPRCKETLKEFILERSSEHYEPRRSLY